MKVIYHVFILLAILTVLSSGIVIFASGRASITSNIVAVKDFFLKMPPVYIYFLLGLFVVGIIFNFGYTRIANVPETRITRLMNKTRKHLKKGENKEASELYEEARTVYSKLSPLDKVRHYNTIMDVYNELLAQTRTEEAKELAEKYAAGEISKEELQRFEMILKGY